MRHEELQAIERFLEPWIGLADDDGAIEKFRGLEFVPGAIRGAINRDLIPTFLTLDRDMQVKILTALQATAAEEDEKLIRLWDADLPPFPIGPDPKLLFRMMLEEASASTRL
jgi:hypothetical protein